MKRLIIIGNGCDVLSTKRGYLIDEFDIVVRVGNFKIDGFESHVGRRTDFCVTSHWKIDYDRLNTTKTILTFPVFESYENNTLTVERDRTLESLTDEQLKNITYVMSNDDASDIIKSFQDIKNTSIDTGRINPSLGYRAIWLTMKLFKEYTCFSYGFDFFKTGWYWKLDHNRDVKNRHPYFHERMLHSRLLSSGRIIKF